MKIIAQHLIMFHQKQIADSLMTENKHKNFLLKDATDRELEQAAAFNHTQLFCLDALTQGGQVHRTGEFVWTHAGEMASSMIAFPNLEENHASQFLDEVMQYYLDHPPKEAGCWSLDPPQPTDLGVRLLARGFQPGWHPNWMSLDLEELQSGHAVPQELRIVADNETPIGKIKGLPYGGHYPKIFSGQSNDADSYLQRFIAIMDGKIVAHCGVLLTKGTLGSAGIYHVGVIPAARNRGIGKAVVAAACMHAKKLGYHYALLNGTGQRMYEQLGFKKLGTGHTWWLITARLLAHPPSRSEVILAEAIGRGDVIMLESIGRNIDAINLSSPITNGMTLMQLAVHFRQPASAEWLMKYGISVNVIEAWDLGWKDLAATLAREQPGQANMRHGEWGLTLLHMAADRDDTELARLALSAKPDLKIKDTLYKSTALDWARHLQKQNIIDLIQKYSDSNFST